MPQPDTNIRLVVGDVKLMWDAINDIEAYLSVSGGYTITLPLWDAQVIKAPLSGALEGLRDGIAGS